MNLLVYLYGYVYIHAYTDMLIRKLCLQACIHMVYLIVCSTPRDSTPRDSTPRGSSPRDSTPRGSSPRDSTPRDSTPRDSTPRDSTPRGSSQLSTVTYSFTNRTNSHNPIELVL